MSLSARVFVFVFKSLDEDEDEDEDEEFVFGSGLVAIWFKPFTKVGSVENFFILRTLPDFLPAAADFSRHNRCFSLSISSLG